MKIQNLSFLRAGFEDILAAPSDVGTVEMIVRRPENDEREELEEGYLDVIEGLVGDNWIMKGSSATSDGASHPMMQITLMNSRVIARIAGDRENWKPAGDQFFVDFDLTPENIPPGTRLRIGEAEVEVTVIPHTGCDKFAARFGDDAERFVNSKEGLSQNLRGVNARVTQPGKVLVGDAVSKVS